MKALLLLSLLAANAEAKSITLHCLDEGQAFKVTGVSTKKIQVEGGSFGDLGEVAKRADGDCNSQKGYDCYQDGQFMVNVPHGFATGRTKNGNVWINTDTDDSEPGNHRRGVSYECTAE